MKLHYYAETDSLYIELADRTAAATREIAEGVNLDLVAEGRPVGLDIDGASRTLNLETLETIDLPLGRLRAA